MGYAYSNNGWSCRAWSDPATIAPGEVYFADLATDAELEAAFPQHDATRPVVPYALFKTTIIGRMSDAELEAFAAGMAAASLRARMMWDQCVHVMSDAPLFPELLAALTAAFGAERAAEILAKE